MQLILLRWFAVQQQTIRLRQKTFGSFYLKFSTKFYELSLFFLKATGNEKKLVETKVVHKNANRGHSQDKG